MDNDFVSANSRLLTCCYFTLLIFSAHFRLTSANAGGPKLDPTEVEALKIIGTKLGKTDWDFSVDPCSGIGNWAVYGGNKDTESSVTCDCSFDYNSTCHIVKIALKSQNLTGILPPEFSELEYLEILDLSRNVLTGSIPFEWITMRLTDLSLMTNNLSGPFPLCLTEIRTLQNLSLEGNSFSGPIPSEVGNLIRLQRLHLRSNSFSGALPPALSLLVNLLELSLSDNNFSGQIPSFINSWKQIQKLHIQGTSLEGPIPSSISTLTQLMDLRISDLSAGLSPFPNLSKMTSIRIIIMRRCFIYGAIPNFIGVLERIEILDLSYNYLTGVIPATFERLSSAHSIYLTGNNLVGMIPRWLIENSKNVDLSYNNFTWDGTVEDKCLQGNVNLVESFSNERTHSCNEKAFKCSSNDNYALHIDCGGQDVMIDGTNYQSDMAPKSASLFYRGPNWALSSIGDFMDSDDEGDVYKQINTYALSNISEPFGKLYTSARSSPLSVTYYGLCLLNGPYFVELHFAELLFSNDKTFRSLGRRIFDVYVQGTLVLKDFDIAREAGGASKPIVKSFNVNVTKHTLEIRLYWAGKGTTGVPVRGVYGPLISAISIDPNFTPPPKAIKIDLHLVAGVVFVGLICIIMLSLFVLRRKGCLRWELPNDEELKGLDSLTGLFTLRQLKAATNNFHSSNKIGKGGFGAVYKGSLSDGSMIAVKKLSTRSKQGSREFINEIGVISSLEHPNLVKLYGCCTEGNQLLLVYEYMENNCLSRALFGKNKALKVKLDWPTRMKICMGIARGLRYLHEESIVKIVHRDIKSSNVLLDKEMNAKISDFGLAKLNAGENTNVSTRVAGTVGYMAPEYAMRGQLTSKADVYSFGLVTLEIVSGKSNMSYIPTEEFVYLLDWANVMQEKGTLLELVDPDLESNYSSEEAMAMLNVALMCTNASPCLRPTISQVISMLEGDTNIQEHLSDPNISHGNTTFSFRSYHWEGESQLNSRSAMSILTDSSSSAVDGDVNSVFSHNKC